MAIFPPAPRANAQDTAFTRDLKTAIRAIYEQLRAQKIQGDNTTFSVTPGAAGMVGHAISAAGYKTVRIAATDATAGEKAEADYLCNGMADQVQIEAAIASLAASGGKVILSSGTFTVTTIAFNAIGDIEIEGSGVASTKIEPHNAGTTCLDITGTQGRPSAIFLHDFLVDPRGTVKFGTGLEVNGVAKVVISELDANDCTVYSLNIVGAQVAEITNCALVHATSSTAGLYCASRAVYIASVDVTATGSTNSNGIWVVADAGIITECTCDGCLNNGIVVGGSIVVYGCTCPNNAQGISVWSAGACLDYNTCNSNSVVGIDIDCDCLVYRNTCNSNTTYGIRAERGHGTGTCVGRLVNNTCDGNSVAGIYGGSLVVSNTITNNTVVGITNSENCFANTMSGNTVDLSGVKHFTDPGYTLVSCDYGIPTGGQSTVISYLKSPSGAGTLTFKHGILIAFT